MTLQTAMLATLIVILGAAQYALCVQAIRDLVRRPRVRGENKVLWGLGILCLPIGGAILYNWMGPTSFIHRPLAAHGPGPEHGHQTVDIHTSSANVTPISAARSARRRRVAEAAHMNAPSTAKRAATGRNKVGRTGS
ncbi:MAG: PLD nuclease N-terminal domain-containing protein [Chloroflexota bacterium]|nr:PLD nuclease N-terminal domain-containing protein [Chloroflexota bacterium]